MTEAHHLFRLEVRDFLHNVGRIGGRLQRIRDADFRCGESQGLGENFGSLCGADERAGDQDFRLHAEFFQTQSGGARFLNALCSEGPFGLGRGFGVRAVYGNAVAHDVQDHGLSDLFLSLAAAELGPQMKLLFEQAGLPFASGDVEPGAVGGTNHENSSMAGNLNVNAIDTLSVF